MPDPGSGMATMPPEFVTDFIHELDFAIRKHLAGHPRTSDVLKMPESKRVEFRIRNYIREIIFVLVFVLAFVATTWLVPFPYNCFINGSILLLLPMLKSVQSASDLLNHEIFDRIKMRRFGVEYCGGTFSENWQRPYNEFRVEYVEQNWILFNLHRVRLKHRVLPNLVVEQTLSKDKAEQIVSDLIRTTPLKLLKNGE